MKCVIKNVTAIISQLFVRAERFLLWRANRWMNRRNANAYQVNQRINNAEELIHADDWTINYPIMGSWCG